MSKEITINFGILDNIAKCLEYLLPESEPVYMTVVRKDGTKFKVEIEEM